MYSRRLFFAGVAVVSIGGGQVHAAANLLVNGDFSQETLNGSTINQSYGLGTTGYTNPSASYSGATATGWVNGGYTFVFVPGSGTSGTTADTAGAANAELSGGNLSALCSNYPRNFKNPSIINGLEVFNKRPCGMPSPPLCRS